MYIKITYGTRGPINSVHKVYMEVSDNGHSPWYIIKHQEGYHLDSSHIQDDDTIHYRHPYATESNGFKIGHRLPEGFTFIPSSDCIEVKVSNNREAKTLLSKEW